MLAAVVAACALLVAIGTFAAVRLTSQDPANSALAELITEVTTVPVGTSAPGDAVVFVDPPQSSSAYSSTLVFSADPPTVVSGPPLASGGRPEILYVATEYCSYCAAENWPLIVALSRFGHFTGLTTSRSADFDHITPIDTWTFHGSSYTSPYLTFVPVETRSNVLVSPKADMDSGTSYRVLQRLTPAEQAVFGKYGIGGETPFLDFANRATQTGSGIPPSLLAGKTWRQIAAVLRQPRSSLGAALLNQADTLTAELCRLTGDRPAAACPQFIRALDLNG